MLKEESEKNRRKAEDLANEQMETAAKRRLAVYLLCKQLRSNVESVMADMDAARLQLLMQPDHPQSQTIERVNKLLRESATERERTTQAFSRMTDITQLGVEQTMGDLEGYGIKKEAIDNEFRKLKRETGNTAVLISKEETTSIEKLPEVPIQEGDAKLASIRKKKREEEKG